MEHLPWRWLWQLWSAFWRMPLRPALVEAKAVRLPQAHRSSS